ncbi:MAG: endonuclease MutS2 [Oscillospiraceae bacterium]
MNKYFKTLELHKILNMLAAECSNEESRMLARNLEPSSDYSTVKLEVDKASQALDLCMRFGSPSFISFKDIKNSITRAKSGASLSLRELLDIGDMLRQIQLLHDWHGHCENIQTELDYLFSGLMPNSYLKDRIETSIISDDEVSDNASAELASIRRKIAKAGADLRNTLDKMIKSSSVQKCLQESIITMRDGRYVLPVKAEHKGAVQGLVHDTSSSGQTLFIEPASVVETNNNIKILERMEQDEIERIIAQLSADCAAYGDILIANYKICAEINLYFAKASLAIKMKAFPPIVSDDGIVILKKARHPLINPSKVVPVDISLGENYQSLIITGPNTGGKTVSLKTMGLLTAMTMCGLLIPAAEGSKVSVFDHILVDIGDSQSIENDLSTFSAHTNKVIEILHLADSKSLVLLDELGSGTDPVEGAALAIAIIEKLKSYRAKLMVTTHYQELKLYAIETDNVENASCEFDIKSLRPTYKLIIGSPGKSNAFAISKGLGMPDDVINHAKSLINEENLRIEAVIEKLDNARSEFEHQNNELKRLNAEVKENSEKLKAERDSLHDSIEAEMEKARLEASAIVERTKVQSNELLDELEKIKKDKDKASFGQKYYDARSGVKRAFNKMYDEANPVQSDKNADYVLPRALKRGDNVLIVDLNKKGIIAGEVDSSGLVYVQTGVMKTKVNIRKLRLLDEKSVQQSNNNNQRKKGVSIKGVQSKSSRKASMELDIRGKAADEGVYEMEAFIDNAVLANMGTVTIIHGKGTGILRAAVHQRLKQLKSVKSFRLGLFGEGEDGVTIVQLK